MSSNIETTEPAPAGYAGNVLPKVAWQVLAEDPAAQLVDVRTTAEWAYVGTPDLSSLNKDILRVEWQTYPNMQVDPNFSDRISTVLREHGATPETPVFFICRSGNRSAHAAEAATAAGWHQAYNIATGFEGDRDDQGHRGKVAGWKVDELPWTQT